ncbi:hypothetical protein ILYODFUR_014758 [Ilyodon furcidens]|uniref:Uncharacterized protein n=1 Tax=Ilyodon furcidens TaxID=33524 RepID=A0ABV0TUQ0_9TELE
MESPVLQLATADCFFINSFCAAELFLSLTAFSLGTRDRYSAPPLFRARRGIDENSVSSRLPQLGSSNRTFRFPTQLNRLKGLSSISVMGAFCRNVIKLSISSKKT